MLSISVDLKTVRQIIIILRWYLLCRPDAVRADATRQIIAYLYHQSHLYGIDLFEGDQTEISL